MSPVAAADARAERTDARPKQGRRSKAALPSQSYRYNSTVLMVRTRGVSDLFGNHGWALFLLIAIFAFPLCFGAPRSPERKMK
jgi:hypothetical protein